MPPQGSCAVEQHRQRVGVRSGADVGDDVTCVTIRLRSAVRHGQPDEIVPAGMKQSLT